MEIVSALYKEGSRAVECNAAGIHRLLIKGEEPIQAVCLPLGAIGSLHLLGDNNVNILP